MRVTVIPIESPEGAVTRRPRPGDKKMIKPENKADRKNLSAGKSNRRLFILDPQPVVRFGLRCIFDSQPDLRVVGESDSCSEIVQAGMGIDMIMVDPELGDVCGTEVLRHIRAAYPDLPVLVFTASSDELRVVETVQSGVQGYLTKTAKPADIVQAARVVCSGGCYLDPRVTSLVMGQIGRARERRQNARCALTARERNVLSLLVQGKRNREISDALFIGERTVRFHLTSLFQKLQVANRTEAVRKAVRQGLVSA